MPFKRYLAFAAVFALQLCFASSVAAQPLATVKLSTGWATFGQALPEGVASAGLRVGTFATQTDIKNRWPDGSIRFAIVSVYVPAGGDYPIQPAAISTGSFAPNVPTASVALTSGTVAYTAILPTAASSDRWLSGPLVYEGRSVVAPRSSATGLAHPFLRINFDTRVYNDGQARVDVSVENVLDQAGATTVTYDAAITVNGAQVFTKSSVQHYYLTRWRKVFKLASTALASITPDIAPFNASRALPPYLPLVANVVSAPAGVNYEILQGGALLPNMPEHGGRPELAPYPDWTARYLVHKDLTQRAFVLANGDLAGSWPIHMREAGSLSGVGSERLVSIDQRPNVWLDERAQSNLWDYIKGAPLPIREYGSTIPGPGQTALIPDNAHQPSLAYVPYLLTGDRYYAEEMAFWANYGMVRTFPGDGLRSSQGLLINNETRGIGWPLRNLVDAATYYPDASPVKAYLSQKVLNNLQYLDTYANSQNPVTNPFQMLWINRRPEGGQYISLWEQTYLAHAIDRANQQGFAGGLANRDAIARLHLGLFSSEPDYPRAQAGAYLIAVGTPSASNPAVLGTFYTSMAQVWSATQGQERPFAGFYGPEARMNLMYGVRGAWPGAQAAYDYLWPFIGVTTAPCLGQNIPDLACRAGWALDLPSTTTATPGPAQMTSPVPSSTLTGPTQVFQWNTGVAVSGYQLSVGTAPGANDIYSGPSGTSLSASVSALPTGGETIWARLSSNIAGAWQSVDYSVTAANIPKTAPAITWPVPADIAFGTPLGAAQLTASAIVPGAFAYTPAAGTVLGVGSSTLSVTFTPSDVVNYRSTTATVLLNVTKATPTVAWNTPPAIVYRTALGASQLNATSAVPGSFVYSPAAGTVLGVGASWLLSVTFTPTDTATYTAATATVPLAVIKATPVVTWPIPADIVFGTPLGTSQLNATANVPGTFAYTQPAGTVLGVGAAQTLSVTFNPSDSTNYAPATATVLVNVTRVTPSVVWNAPAPIVFGTPLGALLNASVGGLPGSFGPYTAGATVVTAATVLNAGSWVLSVTFTPADAATYTSKTATVPLTVLKAAPVVTWAAPANIVTGTALTLGVQLNATANVAGNSFLYAPVQGTVLPVGTAQRLAVTFTPTDTANFTTATAAVPITVVNPASTGTATPIKIGSAIAGTFNDATGHSGQSHLVFAPNAAVWWLFTLSSAHDAVGDRTVQGYFSSGPDLATATWTAAPASPNLANVGGASNSLLAGGRSLGAAIVSIGSVDYVHLFASAAFDGQVSSNGHLRAQLGKTSITWGAWNDPGSPNAASQWQGPAGTGASGAASKPSWGNSVGVSTGGFIHHFSVVMDQEVDCSVGRSTNADTTASWTNGFGNNVSPTGNTGTSPPWTTAVIDKTMVFECKALTFAPLASDVMLAVYSNGVLDQPNLNNLRYQKSGASGTWTNIPVSGGGDGNVFSTTPTINQNDWTLVPVSATKIYAFRRNGTSNPTPINGASYATGTNTWSALSPAPPAFGAGQSFKASAGLFGATDGTNVWLFAINTDIANSILFTKFNGTSWTSWTAVPGTNTGTQVRNFIAGYPKVAGSQIGLAWTQGTTSFDVFATSLSLGSAPPSTATLTAPAGGSTVGGITTVSATATPGSGAIAGVQFVLDGVPVGVEGTTSPYSISWDTKTTFNGTHFLAAIARDTNGGTGASSTVTVTVNNDVVSPTVVMTTPADGATASQGTAVTVSANASDDVGVVGVQFLLDGIPLGAEDILAPYTLTWDTTGVSRGVHTLAARARDAANNQTTSASVSVTVKTTPTLTWPAPAAIVYGTALGAAQLNATASVPGTFVYAPAGGTVPAAGTRTLTTIFTPTDTANFTTATASVTITVSDTTPPTVVVSPNAIVEATGRVGAAYFFGASANDPVDGSVGVTCIPPSGTTFPLGATTVTCTATDLNGNSGSASFILTVRDTTPPLVTAPAAISVPATEMAGARGNVAGSVGSQTLAAFVSGGVASDLYDPAPVRLAPQVIVNGTPIDATAATLFPPGTTTVVYRFRDVNGNIGSSASSVTVTARVADEPTVVRTTAVGGARLKALQNPDGGWSFEVGSNVCGGTYGTCGNTIGTTALGLLAAYVRSGDTALLAAAAAAGDAIVARYTAAMARTPAALPVFRDIEFLVGLAQLSGNPVYASTARAWFQVAVDRFPTAADQIDDLAARRNAQRLRSVVAWDAASYIRAAKAVGLTDRALAAAVRIRDLEPSWKDTNPAHRFDQCITSSGGCGAVDNPWAFDFTLIGEGSLLWAIHDLPGFDAQLSEYRSFLLAQQDPAGSWDVGDTQVTAFVVMGLAAVGGPGTSASIASAAGFFLASEFPTGGWPSNVSPTSVGAEYGEVDGEVVRAMATLFSTPAGADVSVVPSQLSTVTFSSVTAAGTTTVVAIDQATAPQVTGGFEIANQLTYQVSTTATISGAITVCFSVPWITDPTAFAALRLLHGESGVMVDRTILAPDQPAPDFATRRVCARTTSLSPFALAFALPDTTPPVVTVPAPATIEATGPLGALFMYTVSAMDDVDGAVVASCGPASGATFALGTTTVQCTAADAHGNTGASSFPVTVRDTTPPVITVPATVTIEATAPRLSAVYAYTASAIDAVDGALTPACAPASGATFPVGSTTVTCTAADAAGNAGSGSFVVTVISKAAVNVAPVAYSGQFTTTVDTTLAGILTATDVNGDRLTFQIVANPSKGLVVVNATTGAFTYTPHSHRKTTDRFTFRVSDGSLWSNTATVTVTMTKVKGRQDERGTAASGKH